MREFVEKLIERLEELKEDSINENCPVVPNSEDCEMEHSCASCFSNASIKIVKQLAEEYKSNLLENLTSWIPVTERLPEESLNSVLGWDEYRGRCCLVQYLGSRWVLGNDVESVKITAWMPLPDPYKPEQKEMPTDHFTERFNRVL